MAQPAQTIPSWLLEPEDYEPVPDRDRFIGKSMLSITGVLVNFRLDDGQASRFSPSAPAKLIVGLAVILLASLSSNYFYVLVLLACLMVRLCFIPGDVLKRIVGVALAAAGLTFAIMLPAIFIGQSHSAVLIATKVLVSVGTAMTVALTTPYNQLTAALRVFHVPNLFIFTIDLALKNIVRLGRIALQMLEALRLRSVGRNQDKGKSVGGIGGTVFLKTSEAASAAYDAMCCRGFEGEYPVPKERQWRAIDLAWFAGVALLVASFIYLQGAM
ncbi:MAG: energy-coupling factor transporter transmembrane component T [Eggerthellaceae bacterium]|jgi:cobalt/nickel transport system permease protein